MPLLPSVRCLGIPEEVTACNIESNLCFAYNVPQTMQTGVK